MIAHWVDSLEQYATWIRGVIESSGGELVSPLSGVPYLLDAPLQMTLGGAEIPAYVMPGHRLRFPDGSTLDFWLEIARTTDGFEYGQYGYDYRGEDRVLIWRYDKHPGHEDVGETHVHVGGERRTSAMRCSGP